ncbi:MULTISPECIES: universal stress protein [Bacillus]|uniref:universal stress protein n=1 Tax=Bacillus TaxID=1386 RepID=UPI0004253A70|nr:MULTISPECIES: universal stress protein [Bacillus]QHZ46071.1 universal stress protein [Bacillus sp. NSP9.1]WFA06249.1 universal stress protein [Bacillus sp. HSf4]
MLKADRIIVAFDEKEESKKALQKAIVLTKKLGAELTIAHVHEPKQARTASEEQRPAAGAPYLYSGIPAAAPVPHESDPAGEPLIYEDSAEEAIAAAKIILNNNQFDADIEVLEGDPANAVLHHAEHIGADLVITGTRDQNRLKKLLFGSVSDKISSKSEIPVLIVK